MLRENEVKVGEKENMQKAGAESGAQKIQSITKAPGLTTSKLGKKGSVKTYFVAALIVLFVVGGVGFYVYKNNKNLKKQEMIAQQEEKRIAEEQRAATERKLAEEQKKKEEEQKAAEALAKLKETTKVRVLNGTNINGLAGTTADSLEESGYVEVSAGNSPTRGHTTTTISYVEGLSPAVLDDVKSVLEKTFASVEAEVIPQAEKGDYDIVITLGSSLKTNKGN